MPHRLKHFFFSIHVQHQLNSTGAHSASPRIFCCPQYSDKVTVREPGQYFHLWELLQMGVWDSSKCVLPGQWVLVQGQEGVLVLLTAASTALASESFPSTQLAPMQPLPHLHSCCLGQSPFSPLFCTFMVGMSYWAGDEGVHKGSKGMRSWNCILSLST